jgi:hypothetical protein
MTGFEPAISPLVVGLWLAGIVALTVRRHRLFANVLTLRYRWGLTALGLAVALLIALMLLQPYRDVTRPDRDGFRVAVLADVSNSMGVRDLPEQSRRISIVQRSFATGDEPGVVSRLQEAYRLDVRAFTDELRPVPSALSQSPEASSGLLLPGRTALGDALKACLDEFAGVPLGAVLILSDGRSNTGMAPSEAAKICRARDVPVSCIGIGERRTPGDVRVLVRETTQRVVKGKPFPIVASVENHFGRDIDAVAELRDDQDRLISVQAVSVPARSAQTVRFDVTPVRAGFTSWIVRLRPVPDDLRRDNDVDFAGIEVREPDEFNILYLGGHLSWEFRFIRILVDRNDQLNLAAAIRSGKDTFYRAGLPDDVAQSSTGLPATPDVLNRYDAVLLDTRAVPLLGDSGLAAVQGFVENRGGGLLCFGPMDDVPKVLADMLPVRPTEPAMLRGDARLSLNGEFIFDRDPAAVLRTSRGVPLYAGGPFWFPVEIKPGARPAASVAGSDRVAVAAQRFGSGRVAYMGMETTWRWRLQDSVGEDMHTAFWNAMLVWLGSTGKKRLEADPAARKTGVGDSLPLDVTVLGTDFRPAPDARVTASVRMPDGEDVELSLDPSAEAPGRYTGVFFPEDTGQYAVRYRVRLPNDAFDEQVHFLARQTGVEAEDTTYAEDVLRDVARVTRGTFWEYRQMGGIESLPLSDRVPVTRERWYWARSWPIYVLLTCLASTYWLLRRRIGLR